jgi:signal transduction histidine kinase
MAFREPHTQLGTDFSTRWTWLEPVYNIGTVRFPQLGRAVAIFLAAAISLYLYVFVTEHLYYPNDAVSLNEMTISVPEGDRAAEMSSNGYGMNYFYRGGQTLNVSGNIAGQISDYEAPAILVPRARRALNVTLNGVELVPTTSRSTVYNYGTFRPHFFPISPEAIAAGTTDRQILDISVRAVHTQPFLEFPNLGERDALARNLGWRAFFGFTVMSAGVVVSLISAMIGFALAIWRRDRWLWASFGGLMLSWGAIDLIYAGGLSASDSDMKRITFSLANYFLIILSMSFVNEATHGYRWMRRILMPFLLAIAVLKVLPMMLIGGEAFTYVTISMDLIAAAAVLWMLWQIFSYIAQGSRISMVSSFIFVIAIFAVIADICTAISPDIALAIWPQTGMSIHAGSAMAILVALSVIANFARTFFQAQDMLTNANATLTRELAARESEIRQVYAERAQQQREATLLDERKRIMRDMHDGIGGKLLSISLRARSGDLDKETLSSELDESLQQLRLIVDSMDTADGELDIALGALRGRIEPPLQAAGIKLSWRVEELGEDTHYGPREVLSVYRMIQETVTNAIRHSGADHLSVSAKREGEDILLQIEDNGTGMVDSAHPGNGLSNISDRARGLGGEVDFSERADGTSGLSVNIRLPRDPDHDPNN